MNIIVLGQQGCGKGTQADKLAKKYNWDHFDTGNVLRQISKIDSALGREVNEIVMVKKELVPSRILQEVLHNRLTSLFPNQGIVFDGVPRNLEQAKYFEDVLLSVGRKIDKIFFVNVSEAESIKRISKRWTCNICKTSLIMGRDIKSEKDTCPKCGKCISQRADDIPEGIRKRLGIFNAETMPVINRYQELGLVVKIDGQQEMEKVFADIVKSIEK